MNNNYMKLEIPAKSENESFARVTVASFISQMDPTLEEVNDIKTVVSEAVTNSVIHGYENEPEGIITISVSIKEDHAEIIIEDEGRGIENVEQAVQPLYTTKPELERSGMGFTIMENLMDNISIQSELGKGTKICLFKRIVDNRDEVVG